MHESDTTDPNIQALRRIVALFLAIAGFAERAAARSPLVRWPALLVLRPGEAVARDRVRRLMRDFGLLDRLDSPEPDADASGADQAAHLARSFRVLAAAVAALAEMLAATCAIHREDAPGTCKDRPARGRFVTPRASILAIAWFDSS